MLPGSGLIVPARFDAEPGKSATELAGMNSAVLPENRASGRAPAILRSVVRAFMRGILGGTIAALLLWAGQDYRPTATEAAIASYRFNLLAWELGNITDKWHRQLNSFLPWNSPLSREERISLTQEFFTLGEELRRLESDLLLTEGSYEKAGIRDRIGKIEERRAKIQPEVEQAVEEEISAILIEEGFASRIGVVLPPVDTVFDRSPALLVTSPRDRISRQSNILLRHGIGSDERASLEYQILEERNLSAIVENTGGIGTYPSVVSSVSSMHHAITTVAHEWLHNWFFFQPLGQHFWDSADMTTLNETAATLGGWEIGDRAYEAMTGVKFDRKPPAPPAERDPEAFDFNDEMRETRRRAEELLAEGRIEEAEGYMEQRRLDLLEHGYRIRKINQAFFAFHGSYATSAASVSPIEGQLRELRERSDSLGEFLKTVARFAAYDEFLEYLEQ